MTDRHGFKTCAAMVAVTMMLAIVGLAGCAFLGEPTSTESLLVRYAANPNNDNFVVDATADAAVRVSSYRASMPVTAHAVAAGGSAHGNVVVDMSSLGDDQEDMQYDLYVEQDDTTIAWYLGVPGADGTTWTKSEVDLSFTLDVPTIVELLSNATFMPVSYQTDEAVHYELILRAADLAKTILGKGEVTTSFGEVDEDALLEALGDSKVHVCFTEDCLVRSVRLDLDFTYEDENLLPMPITLDFGFVAAADDYGNVSAADAAVPDEVKEAAVLTDDPINAKETAARLQGAMD